MMAQLLRFAAVGCVGFAIDVAVLQLLLAAGAGLLGGRAGSFLAAATTTWALNRRFTFNTHAPATGPAATGRQWLRFLAANGVGGTINFGVYTALVLSTGLCHQQPALAVAAGSLAGLAFNFAASRHWVFPAPRHAGADRLDATAAGAVAPPAPPLPPRSPGSASGNNDNRPTAQ